MLGIEGGKILDWGAKATNQVILHRDKLRWLYEKIVGRSTHIVVAGLPGVGKTVLIDAITDAKGDYQKPGQSIQVEPRKRKIKGRRSTAKFFTFPGQESPERGRAVQEYFGRDRVDGVLYVASYGLVKHRDETAKKVLYQRGIDTIAKLQEEVRKAELADFDRLCGDIRSSIQRSRRLSWLIIAVTKADLYHEEAEAVADYYKIGPFAERVKESLMAHVGTQQMITHVVPVCAHPEELVFHDDIRKPCSSDQSFRNDYLRAFQNTVDGFCA